MNLTTEYKFRIFLWCMTIPLGLAIWGIVAYFTNALAGFIVMQVCISLYVIFVSRGIE